MYILVPWEMYNTQINTRHTLKFGFNLTFNYNLNWLWFWLSASLNVISFILEPVCNQRSCGSIQFSSVTQSCPTLCNPMDCSMPGFPVHYQLLELAQIHVHRVSDAFQPSHPLSSFSSCLQSFFGKIAVEGYTAYLISVTATTEQDICLVSLY